ncbi:MAG: ABC transporter permease subunit [Alphaproteobacteria bacterium]|nr:ABC transporter permease subunit [Alphaproteobacteria bacterium]
MKKVIAKNTLRKALKDYQLYLMFIPGFIVLAVFAYYPMYGLILSFKSYSPVKGITGSPWVSDPNIWGNFQNAVLSYGFLRLVRNTLLLGLLKIIFAFPSSIILALLINELRVGVFKKTIQTISYLPYFISWVIVASIMYLFLASDVGFFNKAFIALGMEPVRWYISPQYWRAILTVTTIWKNTGWGTIIFLAGLTSISPELYEAARCDGAGRWRQTIHVSIPGIMPVIAMSFILSVSGIVKDDFEQVYALVGMNSELWKTVDVIGSWMYRGLRGPFRAWGEVTAVGLVQSIVSFVLMVGANAAVKRSGNKGIW